MGVIQKFKGFAIKGTVVDMAVEVIIGSAFWKIVSSFVKDVIMPPISLPMGGMDFSKLSCMLQDATATAPAAPTAPEILLTEIRELLNE